mmetsp:Transcript_7199/g.18393  ORF Transcript_7199/g.18393 Transcript_7199/m.18393 type:complete len:238 (-) Transcript_7199:1673-2386(-)
MGGISDSGQPLKRNNACTYSSPRLKLLLCVVFFCFFTQLLVHLFYYLSYGLKCLSACMTLSLTLRLASSFMDSSWPWKPISFSLLTRDSTLDSSPSLGQLKLIMVQAAATLSSQHLSLRHCKTDSMIGLCIMTSLCSSDPDVMFEIAYMHIVLMELSSPSELLWPLSPLRIRSKMCKISPARYLMTCSMSDSFPCTKFLTIPTACACTSLSSSFSSCSSWGQASSCITCSLRRLSAR